ncbi:MAG: sigma-70 family RNA polymerase sigma factor [Zavarzinella sp.]|nr:sigma-70 family RNA polymerase sigma factor [Zavarzinella sp.]
MDRSNSETRLSGVQTLWSQLRLAHDDGSDARQAAREALLRRYAGAVRRYLIAVVRDREAADDLAQEFALRFLRGDFRNADPGRGRFRDYVKVAVLNLVNDHHRRQKARPVPVPPEDLNRADSADSDDGVFRECWGDELLGRAWKALAAVERETGRPLHTVLKLRATHPKASSTELAAQVGARLGKAVTPAGVRQTLHRAREKFAELLLDAVADTLDTATRDRLGEELEELGLLDYCKPALENWQPR